jgi:hypothetical protein
MTRFYKCKGAMGAVLPLGRKIPYFRKFGKVEGNKKEMTF